MTQERVIFASVAAVALALLPGLVDRFLRAIGLVRPNYRQILIPVGYGLVTVLWATPALWYVGHQLNAGKGEWYAYLVMVGGMGALGFADDLWGDRSSTGLRGHFSALLKAKITTGFIKAVGGAALSLVVAHHILHEPKRDAILVAMIIALSANAMNLLDLRPGRAGSVFLVSAIALIGWHIAHVMPITTPPLAFVAVPALLVYERDARACAMLGDAGSNPLGAALGLAYCISFTTTPLRLTALGALVGLHIVAERWSITSIIAANPLLRRVDALTGKR